VADEFKFLKNDNHYGPPNLTPEWQVIDGGIGKKTKDEAAEVMDMLQEGMSEEARAAMTASERRIMITKAG